MNLRYLFYSKYVDGNGELDEATHKKILKASFGKGAALEFTANIFVLKTHYPGLLIGIGNAHFYKRRKGKNREEDVRKEEEAFKIGFSLDYTTGLPIIPGSSIKGAIRHGLQKYFEQGKLDDGGSEWYGKDVVFLDAMPIYNKRNGNESQQLFEEEFITPHGEDPTAKPNPLKMLKVKPNVCYCFRFLKIRQDQLDLFKEVIKLLGMGAKTNVGYGIMVDSEVRGTDELFELQIESTVEKSKKKEQNSGSVQGNTN